MADLYDLGHDPPPHNKNFPKSSVCKLKNFDVQNQII